MPIIVEHPESGVEYEFPDDMAEKDILAAIEKHSNIGYEQPLPGDDDLSQGLPAGANASTLPPPHVPIPPVGTSGYTPAQQRFYGSPEQQSALRNIQVPYNFSPKTSLPEEIAKKLHLTPREMAEGLQEFASASPDLEPEQAEELRQTPAPEPPPWMQVATGAINAVNKGTASLASPEGAAMLLTAGAPGAIAKAAQLAFGAQMLHGLPETARQAGATSVTGNLTEKSEAYGDLALQLLFTKETLRHGATPPSTQKAPPLNPMREVNIINRSLSTGEFRPGQPLEPALRDWMTDRRKALLEKIHGAEKDMKDLADSYDLPIKISAADPTTQEPWEPGTYAKMGPEGEMYVNRIGLHDILGELNPKQQQRFLKSLVEEEWIHSKVSDKDALEYWDKLTPVEQNIVAKRYAGSESDQFNDVQLAHEALRSRLQQLAHVTPTEIAHADGMNIEARTLIALEGIIGKVRRVARTKASKAQAEIFDRVQKNVEAARSKLGINTERSAIDAGEEGLTPAATSENVPFAFAARKALPLEEYKGELPEGYVPVMVRRADGTTHPAWVTSIEDSKLAGRRLTRVANVVAAGEKGIPELSHGVLGPNDRIVQGPKTPEEFTAAKKGTTNASNLGKTEEIHGDLQPSTEQGKGEVPAAEGGGGVLPREEPAAGGSQENTPEILRLKPAREAEQDSGWTLDPTSQFGAVRTEGLTPEEIATLSKVMPKQFEFTDRRKGSPTEGLTTYVPEGASKADILKQIKAKAEEYIAAKRPTETAAAFRKKASAKSQEEMTFLPGSKEAPRNTEELGLPQVHENKEPVTPAKLADLTTEHMDTPKPSFERFMEDAKERFGDLQPGQLAEAWEDAVWNKLINAPGDELQALVKRLGLVDFTGTRGEGVEPGFIPDKREKAQTRASSTEMFPTGDIKVVEHPPRRANAIARIAEKLIGQSTKKRANLKRKGITPSEIGWWRPKAGELPAFREIPAKEASSQAIGKILTEGGAMERGGAKTTSGLKGYPESVTKRLVALQDRATGRMELVSIYRTGRGTYYMADPAKLGERVHTPLPDILAKKTIAGEQRYVPRYSVLLDEPVQGFKESFKSEADFNERFGAEAAEQLKRREEAEAEADELAPGLEGKPPEKGILFRQEKTSPDSFRALHDLLSAGEEITEESLQSNLEALFAENRPKDPKTGQPRELTIRELKGVDALLYAQDRLMEQAQEQGRPISPEVALSNVLDYLHENKDLSRSEFAAKAIAELAPPERTVPPKAESVPGGASQESKTGARELTLPEHARKTKGTAGVVKAEGRGPKAYLSGKDTPAAFRKPTKEDLTRSLWVAEKAWKGLKDQMSAEVVRNPIAAQIVRWRDAADTIPANAGKKAESGIRVNLEHDTDLARAAVLAYRETNRGDSVLLDNAQASVEAGLADFKADKNLEAVRQGELMLKAIDAVRANKDAFAKANDYFSEEVHAEALLEKSKDISLTEKEDYTPHVYNADGFSDDALLFPSRILGHKFTAAQHFTSYFSAYENGFYPKKYDAAAVLGNRIRRGQKQVQYRVWLDRVKNTVDPHSGAPIAMEAEPYEVALQGGKVETRYRPPSPEYEMFVVSPGQRPIAVRKGYIGLMKVMTMRGPFAESENPLLRGTMNFNGFLKHGVILIFDSFHPSRIAQFGAATIGMRPKFWEAGNRGASALDYSDVMMDKALAKGFITQDSVDWARQTETVRLGSATVELSHRRILEEFEKQGLNVGRISDALYRQFTDQIPIVGTMNRWTFDKLTRGLMAESAVSEFLRLNKKFPNHDARKLMGEVTRDLNFRFGNIGRQGFIRNPAIREISQLLFLAPAWVEGMVQTEARFYARLMKVPFKLGSEKPNMGTIGHVMGRGLAAYFILTQAMNLITKGQPTWKNDEGHKMDAWIPDVTGKTPGFWFSPMSVFAEITHDIVKYLEHSDKSIDAVARIVGNKLGPIGRVMTAFIFRENPQGEKITTTAGVVKQAASELAPAPISLAKAGQAIGHAVAPNTIPPTKPGDVQRQLAASAGFKIDPAPTALRAIRDKAEEFVKKHKLRPEEMEFSYTDQAFMTQLRRAVRDGQEKEGMRLIEKLRESRTDKEIGEAMRRYAKRQFTGSLEHERAFVASLTPKERELYDKAREEKAEQFKAFIALWDKRPPK